MIDFDFLIRLRDLGIELRVDGDRLFLSGEILDRGEIGVIIHFDRINEVLFFVDYVQFGVGTVSVGRCVVKEIRQVENADTSREIE